MNPNGKEIEELTDGWVKCRSKSNQGRQYFFNRKTGKSSWTQPKPGEKLVMKGKKKPLPKQNLQKNQAEQAHSKTVKRKSNECEAGSSKKRLKNETPEKPVKKISPKQCVSKATQNNKTKSPAKPLVLNDSKQTTPTTNKVSPKVTPKNKVSPKVTPKNKVSPKVTPKNSANKRLSQLRDQLNNEVKNETGNQPSLKRAKADVKPATSEANARPRLELPSANVSKSVVTTTTKSPISHSLHSNPTPSQFFAANKIISSMKAQLPDEYCKNEKPKDTFADIEQGICSQMTEYPITKHPSTPPQFSEASKLVSAIKSKLSYSPKEVKTFSSANDRMEAFRASLSTEIDEQDLQDDSHKYSFTSQKSYNVVSNVRQTPDNCEAMEVEEIKESIEAPKPGPQLNVKDPDNGQVVLVVDTNVFIHELDFIKTVLDSHIKGYSEQPILLVPWRVINELDRLKDNNNGSGALCKRARAAMDYLYKSLPENNRIKGQSLRDANSHIYPCELPDDEILNCALQQAERGKNVLLLSNDRNLCNKASMNGISRLGVSELKPLVEPPRAASAPAARVRHCQRTVHQLLASILENEMRAKYNNLWLHVIFKPPPWSLADVLACLLKHWIAVFSDVFPRIEHLVTELKSANERIDSKDPSKLTESEASHFTELCLEVSRKCQIIPEYMQLAKLTVARLGASETHGEGARQTVVARLGASETHDEGARQTVVAAFEALWNIAASYCAKLATALGIPHNVKDTIQAAESLVNLTSKFTQFNGSIGMFVDTVQGVLNTCDSSSLDDKMCRLEAVFRECLCQDGLPTREELRNFCLTNRNMLQEAVSKFSQLRQLLDVCKSKLETST